MKAPGPLGQIVQFGLFQLDPKAGELRKEGVKVRLQDQPFRVLALLVERAGQVVTREELRQRVRPLRIIPDLSRPSRNTGIAFWPRLAPCQPFLPRCLRALLFSLLAIPH
jgi:hypothetical protein